MKGRTRRQGWQYDEKAIFEALAKAPLVGADQVVVRFDPIMGTIGIIVWHEGDAEPRAVRMDRNDYYDNFLTRLGDADDAVRTKRRKLA